MVKFEAQFANDSEKLNVDPDADDLPTGVFVIDFCRYPIMGELEAGKDYVVTFVNISGFKDGTLLVQVCEEGDSAFVKRI